MLHCLKLTMSGKIIRTMGPWTFLSRSPLEKSRWRARGGEARFESPAEQWLLPARSPSNCWFIDRLLSRESPDWDGKFNIVDNGGRGSQVQGKWQLDPCGLGKILSKPGKNVSKLKHYCPWPSTELYWESILHSLTLSIHVYTFLSAILVLIIEVLFDYQLNVC